MGCVRHVLVAIALVSGLTFGAVDCATFKPNPTLSDVQRTHDLAAKSLTAVKQIVIAARGLQDFEIQLHDAGWVSDLEHKRVQTAFLFTFKALDSAVVQVTEATTVPQLRTTLTLVKQNLTDLSNSLAVTHPQAAKMLQTSSLAIAMAVDVLFSLFGA